MASMYLSWRNDRNHAGASKQLLIDSRDTATNYYRLHRRTVLRFGDSLGVENVWDHDLSECALNHIGMGLLFHLKSQLESFVKSAYAPQWEAKINTVREVVMNVIKYTHTLQENHHGQFQYAGRGPIDPAHLFTDRLAVHNQKSGFNDNAQGWAINECFITHHLSKEFKDFTCRHHHVDLASVYKSVKCTVALP